MSNPTFSAKMTPQIKSQPVKTGAVLGAQNPPPASAQAPPASAQAPSQPAAPNAQKDKFFKQPAQDIVADEIAFFNQTPTVAQTGEEVDISQKPPIERAWKTPVIVAVIVAALLAAAAGGWYIFSKKSGVTAEPVEEQTTPTTQPTTVPSSPTSGSTSTPSPTNSSSTSTSTSTTSTPNNLPTKLNFAAFSNTLPSSQTFTAAGQPCAMAGFRTSSEPDWLQTNFSTQNNACIFTAQIKDEALALAKNTYSGIVIITDNNNQRTQIEATLIIE